MTTRNNELERLAKDVSRVDQFANNTNDGLLSLKNMFTEMQRQWEANFQRLENQRPVMNNGESSNGRISNNRLTKVEFPKFEGNDVEGWLYKCDHFFSLDETPENYKVRYAAVHLEGRALSWHQSYVKSSGKALQDITWNEYMRSISARFAQTLVEDAMGALKALTQSGDLDSYCDAFDLLLNKVTLPEEYNKGDVSCNGL